MDKKVFISYGGKDAIYASLLARTLKKKGIDVFVAQDALTSETDWNNVREELKGADAVVALISDNWTQSKNTAIEYGAAYVLGKKIIPIVIDDLKNDILPIDLNQFLTVDAKNEDLESVAHQVEEAL